MAVIINLFNTLFTYPIFNALMELHHLLSDFGLSIVALTCLIFLATFPITWRQLKIARAMQRLQPQLAEIKRRLAGDLVAQTAAQQELYREHNISPSSSLGPLIVQGLTLSGLFFALNTVLHNATLKDINRLLYPFVAHFTAMPDLTLAWLAVLNPAWHIALNLPDPTHLLPLLTGLFTFIQMRMAQPLDAAQARDAMLHTTQMMQFLLILLSVAVTVFFAWQFAAGVALYRLVWLVLSSIQRYFVTGWGSLGVMPAFNLGAVLQGGPEARQEAPRSVARPTRRRHGGASARRRGRNHRGKH